MTSKPKQERAWLLATAKKVASALKQQSVGTQLRVRMPSRVTPTNTDGWAAVIGDLGKGQPRLEIWLDRFSGYPQCKLCACFYSEVHSQITSVTKKVARKLWPVRVLTQDDTERKKYLVLTRRLARSEFNTPVLEKYEDGGAFYGIYDPTRATTERVSPHFCNRAVAFFEDVARALPHASSAGEERDIYPRVENRKRVASHLHRERSRLLATECKIRDAFRCQVCRFRFEKTYGPLGREFAEAHHLIPLSQLREAVRTQLKDLVTVCANCHRMLHRMDGKRSDITRLTTIVSKHRGRRS